MLACKPELYCETWAPGLGAYCGLPGKDGTFCPCASGYECDFDGVTSPGVPPVCAARGTENQPCDIFEPDACIDGLTCRWDVPKNSAQPQLSAYKCQPPAPLGAYCDPLLPDTDFEQNDHFPPDKPWIPQCGPNMYCDDMGDKDVAGLVGHCAALAKPDTTFCNEDGDCAAGERCREFFLGFAKTCGKLRQAGSRCYTDDRFPCDDGLECTYRLPRENYPDALCLKPVVLGAPCDANSLCADDGVCVRAN